MHHGHQLGWPQQVRARRPAPRSAHRMHSRGRRGEGTLPLCEVLSGFLEAPAAAPTSTPLVPPCSATVSLREWFKVDPPLRPWRFAPLVAAGLDSVPVTEVQQLEWAEDKSSFKLVSEPTLNVRRREAAMGRQRGSEGSGKE